jgi:hypothetical protein
VLDLLDFTRTRNRSLLRDLLETGRVTVQLPIEANALPEWTEPLSLEPARDEPEPAPLAIYAEDQRVATVSVQDQADISAILDTGLAITVDLDDSGEKPVLVITLPLAETADQL